MVAIHTDVSDFCSGKKGVNTVYHAESGSQNRDNGNAVFNDHGLGCRFQRSGNADFFGGYVVKGFESH